MFKIVRQFLKEEKKVLGRWNIDHCERKMNRKIDLSNEDHCGPCGEHILHNFVQDVFVRKQENVFKEKKNLKI
jgi:hypothetical protein